MKYRTPRALEQAVKAAAKRSTRPHARPQPYYWFAVGNYMVFYVVTDDVMEVRRFIYGACDPTKMLP